MEQVFHVRITEYETYEEVRGCDCEITEAGAALFRKDGVIVVAYAPGVWKAIAGSQE